MNPIAMRWKQQQTPQQTQPIQQTQQPTTSGTGVNTPIRQQYKQAVLKGVKDGASYV